MTDHTESRANVDSNVYATQLKSLYVELGVMFDAGDDGEAMVRRMCAGVDSLIIDMWRDVAGNCAEEVDLLAVGGYGRGELCPQSDWDLWFLLEDDANPHVNASIERFVYALWDMNVKLGHAVRTVDETMAYVREDWKTATAGLESRLLCGNGTTYAALQKKIDVFFSRKRKVFVEAKLEEMEHRHAQTGGTAFLMEPDIKEGKGGLRDVQTVFWLAKVWHGSKDIADLVRQGAISETEYRNLMQAQDFLWRCRTGLHLEVGRATDRLGFEQQMALAERMDYQSEPGRHAVEAFMKDYFRHAGRIARVSSLLTMHFQEELHPQWLARRKDIGDGFTLEGKWIGVRDGNIFDEDPLRLLRIFHAAQTGHRRLSSEALRQVREHVLMIDDEFRANPEACRIFLRILRHRRNVAAALKQMNDTGILGRFIPEFRHAVGLGQFNNYHAYTVDEHSIRAVAVSRKFCLGRTDKDRFPLACELMPQIRRPELLYLALLFHDLAKGKGRDHSRDGETLARRFCRRLGLNKDDTELVAWLVRNHLFMAMTAQSSDLGEDSVIETFAGKVEDVERLKYLYLLTVADIYAVGPNIWNDWKGSLLRELYYASEQVLLTGPVAGKHIQARIRARIESVLNAAEDQERTQLSQLLKALPLRALIHFPPLQLLAIGRLMIHGKDKPAVDVYIDIIRGETEVLILANNHEGLFAKLTTTIARGHVNIVAAKAFDLGSGRVLDVFHVQNARGRPLSEEYDQQRLLKRIEAVLMGTPPEIRVSTLKPHVLMKRVPVSVHALPSASSRQTAIEIVAADRPGLLAQLAVTIAEQGINVRGASISTFGEKVADVFFLTDSEEKPLSDEMTGHLCERLKKVAVLPEET